MDPGEFAAWTAELAGRGEIGAEAAEDARRQRHLFEEARPIFEEGFGGLVVGYVADELFLAADTVGLLEVSAEARAGGRRLYFEAIGTVAGPGPLADEEVLAPERTEHLVVASADAAREEWEVEYREPEGARASRSLPVLAAWSIRALLVAALLAVPAVVLGVVAAIRGAGPALPAILLGACLVLVLGLIFGLRPLLRRIRKAPPSRRSRGRR